MVHSPASDLRYALRALRASPWFTGIAIVSLAVAVCVGSGIVSVLEASRGHNTPFRNVDRAVALYRTDAELDQGKFGALSHTTLERVLRESRTIASLALWNQDGLSLRTDDWASVAMVANVSAALPRIIGVRAVVGRTFIDADEDPGAPSTIVLAYPYWRTRFAGDSSIVGRTVVLDGKPSLVIGVLEPRAQLAPRTELWRLRPMREMLADTSSYNSAFALPVPGATPATITAELATLGAISTAHARSNRRVHLLGAVPMAEYLSHDAKAALGFLSMIGIIVGLIAATNFAALILARGIRRRGELAIRAALGASTGRLVSYMIAECVIIAVAGGVLGGALAPFVIERLGDSVTFLLPSWMQLSFSLAVVFSAVGLALAVGLVFGLAPALELARPAALGFVRGNVYATQRQRSGRQLLVAVQVALATGPIVFAAMLFGGLVHFGTPSLGFNQRNLYQGEVQGGEIDASWRKPESRAALLDGVGRAPNILSVAIADDRLLGPVEMHATINGSQAALSDRYAEWHRVTPQFFSTYEPILIAGRLPSEDEIARGDPVAVVNESALRSFSLGRVVGWQLKIRADLNLTVVGIVADVKQTGYERNAVVRVYSSLPTTVTLKGHSETVWIRSTPGATRVASGVFDAVRVNAATAALADLKSSVEVTDTSSRELRSIVMITLWIFGVALALATVGIYGTISYAAVMRRKEIAVRLALGASRSHVAGVVTREAAMQVLIGLFFGVAGGDFAAVSMPGVLSKVAWPPLDVVAIACVALAVVMLLASLAPVRQVWGTDCSATLREDG